MVRTGWRALPRTCCLSRVHTRCPKITTRTTTASRGKVGDIATANTYILFSRNANYLKCKLEKRSSFMLLKNIEITVVDLQWRTTVTLASTAIRRPTWTARPARRTITIALSVMPKALDSPADRTAANPVSGRRACTPAPRRVPSPFPVWRTSAATPGPAFRPMGVAPSPACSRWSDCRTSTSPLTSPRGLWCPD